jgi:hypothetical protein
MGGTLADESSEPSVERFSPAIRALGVSWKNKASSWNEE